MQVEGVVTERQDHAIDVVRDHLGGCAVGIAGEHVAHELGGDDEAVALGVVGAEVVADDLLGVALGVDVGGVDEVPAPIDEGVDDAAGVVDG